MNFKKLSAIGKMFVLCEEKSNKIISVLTNITKQLKISQKNEKTLHKKVKTLQQKLKISQRNEEVLRQKLIGKSPGLSKSPELPGLSVSPNEFSQPQNTPSKSMCDMIGKQKKKEYFAYIWKNSIYEDIHSLQSNNSGIIGEEIIAECCQKANIPADIDGSKTKVIGGGEGDGHIKKHTVEIKCARLGSDKSSFQHELGEHPWKPEYIIFVDVEPTLFYITIFPNLTENQYKTKHKSVYFPTRAVTWRKKAGCFKFDTTKKINNVATTRTFPNTIKVLKTTTFDEIGIFINRIVK